MQTGRIFGGMELSYGKQRVYYENLGRRFTLPQVVMSEAVGLSLPGLEGVVVEKRSLALYDQ